MKKTTFINKRNRIKQIKLNMENKAICITFGEQSENHVGMVKYGDGLCDKGFSSEELNNMKSKFEERGCECELIDLNKLLENGNEDAKVLVIRNCIDKLFGDGSAKSLMEDLCKLEWDSKYWDRRRKKVLNKHARYNLCFNEESKEQDYENGVGRVVGYDDVKLLGKVKKEMEKVCGEKKFECEGNYYYNAKKCGIGFHGDAERKKVVGVSLCSEDVVREINWIWYKNSKRISEREVVELRNGDCYVMSEKSSGFDWRRRSINSLRHAAGIKGNKYLK